MGKLGWGDLSIPTGLLKIHINFCYQQPSYLAEIIISTGVPNPLEIHVSYSLTSLKWRYVGDYTGQYLEVIEEDTRIADYGSCYCGSL